MGESEASQRLHQENGRRFHSLAVSQMPSAAVSVVSQHQDAAQEGTGGDDDGIRCQLERFLRRAVFFGGSLVHDAAYACRAR